MKILNLTQHAATPEQIAAGVFEPQDKEAVRELLTFETLPTKEEIHSRAVKLTIEALEHDVKAAMIGGAGYLMSELAI